MVTQPALGQGTVDKPGGEPPASVRDGHQQQVLADCEIRICARDVADHGDLGARDQFVLPQPAAAVSDLPGGRRIPAGRDPQQRGLA